VRDKVLAAVPALEELLERGAPGDQVQSDALQVGDAAEAWVLWFILRPGCLVVAAPVAGLRADAVGDAVGRCNAYNAELDWTVLSVVFWGDEHVATLSARLPVPPEDGGRWEAIAGAMEVVLREAARARAAFDGLINDGDLQ
jgi:hypothetical protein